MSTLKNGLKKIKIDAVWESARSTFAVLGVGSTIACIGTMHIFASIFSFVLIGSTWYGLYRMYE